MICSAPVSIDRRRDELASWTGVCAASADRVLAAIGGMGAYEAAPLFQVSVSWIYKALARRRETGESTARPQVNHVPPKLLEHYAAIRSS